MTARKIAAWIGVIMLLLILLLSSCSLLSPIPYNVRVKQQSVSANIITYIIFNSTINYKIYCSKDGKSVPVCAPSMELLTWPTEDK